MSVTSKPRRPAARAAAGSLLPMRFAAIVAMCGTAAAFVWHCLGLVRSVGSGDLETHAGSEVIVLAFVSSILAVVLVEVAGIARRLQWPEHKLRLALQRIRAGDVGFRVSLRRGDPLTGLARECNDVLEWLNANPPPGVRVGTDIVDMPVDDEEPDA